MQEFNKLLNMRVNRERHEKAMEYCKDNNISLINELRRVIDKYYQAHKKAKWLEENVKVDEGD